MAGRHRGGSRGSGRARSGGGRSLA